MTRKRTHTNPKKPIVAPPMPPQNENPLVPAGAQDATQDFLLMLGQKEMTIYMQNKRIAELEGQLAAALTELSELKREKE